MHGEINVSAVMEAHQQQQTQRAAWQERLRRDAEWVALKQWWYHQRRVRRAPNALARGLAKLELAKTAWLYRRELRRAWPKWRKARLARWHGLVLEAD
ncbi:MAG: hypothetical protein ACRDJW_25480 [Thermomicrobiales bacterium]